MCRVGRGGEEWTTTHSPSATVQLCTHQHLGNPSNTETEGIPSSRDAPERSSSFSQTTLSHCSLLLERLLNPVMPAWLLTYDSSQGLLAAHFGRNSAPLSRVLQKGPLGWGLLAWVGGDFLLSRHGSQEAMTQCGSQLYTCPPRTGLPKPVHAAGGGHSGPQDLRPAHI